MFIQTMVMVVVGYLSNVVCLLLLYCRLLTLGININTLSLVSLRESILSQLF